MGHEDSDRQPWRKSKTMVFRDFPEKEQASSGGP
jgi:hypothetical protein